MWHIEHMGIEKHYKPQNILYLKYEDLKSKKTRVETLLRVTKFLKLKTNSNYYSINNTALIDQLECSFILSESTKAHRTIDSDLYMTKDIAYFDGLVCRM